MKKPSQKALAAVERHRAASHAVQTGVLMDMHLGTKDTEPKHLRTGINVALRDHASLAQLLMRKGIITEDEYLEALADGMEEEQRRYESHLSERTGKTITLE